MNLICNNCNTDQRDISNDHCLYCINCAEYFCISCEINGCSSEGCMVEIEMCDGDNILPRTQGLRAGNKGLDFDMVTNEYTRIIDSNIHKPDKKCF